MASRKIGCKLTGSPSLNKVFEFNLIECYCFIFSISGSNPTAPPGSTLPPPYKAGK